MRVVSVSANLSRKRRALRARARCEYAANNPLIHVPGNACAGGIGGATTVTDGADEASTLGDGLNVLPDGTGFDGVLRFILILFHKGRAAGTSAKLQQVMRLSRSLR